MKSRMILFLVVLMSFLLLSQTSVFAKKVTNGYKTVGLIDQNGTMEKYTSSNSSSKTVLKNNGPKLVSNPAINNRPSNDYKDKPLLTFDKGRTFYIYVLPHIAWIL